MEQGYVIMVSRKSVQGCVSELCAEWLGPYAEWLGPYAEMPCIGPYAGNYTEM